MISYQTDEIVDSAMRHSVIPTNCRSAIIFLS